jgi:hypothetical protein
LHSCRNPILIRPSNSLQPSHLNRFLIHTAQLYCSLDFPIAIPVLLGQFVFTKDIEREQIMTAKRCKSAFTNKAVSVSFPSFDTSHSHFTLQRAQCERVHLTVTSISRQSASARSISRNVGIPLIQYSRKALGERSNNFRNR